MKVKELIKMLETFEGEKELSIVDVNGNLAEIDDVVISAKALQSEDNYYECGIKTDKYTIIRNILHFNENDFQNAIKCAIMYEFNGNEEYYDLLPILVKCLTELEDIQEFKEIFYEICRNHKGELYPIIDDDELEEIIKVLKVFV